MKELKTRKVSTLDSLDKQKYFDCFINSGIVGIIVWDTAGHILYADDTFLDIVGYSSEDLSKGLMSWKSLILPQYIEEDNHHVEDFLRNAEAEPQEKQFIKKDGTLVDVFIAGAFLEVEKKRISFVIDITKQKQVENELKRSKEWFQSLVENSYDSIVLLDDAGKITYLGPSSIQVLGYNKQNLINTNIFELIHPEDKDYATGLLSYLVEKPKNMIKVESRFRHNDGTWRWLEIVAHNLLYEPHVQGIIVNYRDITDRKLYEERINNLAFYDQLTGVPNRSMFKEKLREALKTARTSKSKVAILFLDLDRFKNINDTLGHLAGDTVLKEVSIRILSCVRSDDTVSRQGGDEFAIILPKIHQRKDVIQVAQKILNVLSNPIQLGSNEVYISPSIGIAVYPTDAIEADQLIMNADMAMYSVKKALGNTFRFYNSEMRRRHTEQIELENYLRHAWSTNELLICYQPKVNIKRNKIVGVEALVRWNHKKLGLIPPTKFIPIAEEIGLIERIGEWVLRVSCFNLREWHKQGHRNLNVSVNVSIRQLNKNFVKTVKRILRETKISPALLELEITEGNIMQNEEMIINILYSLKEIGVEISVDDFGTGYSSLNRISLLPIDKLKIDKTLINNVNKDYNHAAIVKAIIAMAKHLKLKVIAEGVETKDQLRFLKRYKCLEIQGFYFSKPIPVDKLTILLEERKIPFNHHLQ